MNNKKKKKRAPGADDVPLEFKKSGMALNYLTSMAYPSCKGACTTHLQVLVLDNDYVASMLHLLFLPSKSEAFVYESYADQTSELSTREKALLFLALSSFQTTC